MSFLINPYSFELPLLLDAYPGAAAAYSVRKLRTAYTGNSIRVRRSSDNVEVDIGFIGNNLDTAALSAFCGAGNGFVTTWYDQSGNSRNVTQSTAASQPRIVNSGTIDKINNKNSLYFNSNYKLNSPLLNLSQPNHVFLVAKSDVTGQQRFIIDNDISGGRNAVFQGAVWSAFAGSTYNTTTSVDINQKLHSVLFNTTNSNYYLNNISIGSGFSVGANSMNYAVIGGYSGFLWNGYIQEVIIYNSNQNTNISGINSNINTYFSIY